MPIRSMSRRQAGLLSSLAPEMLFEEFRPTLSVSGSQVRYVELRG
jgi:hypothetical protein